MLSFEDFKKIELKIGKILAAERVPESDKLLKMQVDLGEKNENDEAAPRQVIAGIGKAYEPENLIGKNCLFVANLEPRLIMGLESQGMILAGTDPEDKPVLLSPDTELAGGTRLR